MQKTQRSFKQLVILHLFIITATSAVFLWVIPIISWLIPIPIAVLFYIWYKREGASGGATKYSRY